MWIKEINVGDYLHSSKKNVRLKPINQFEFIRMRILSLVKSLYRLEKIFYGEVLCCIKVLYLSCHLNHKRLERIWLTLSGLSVQTFNKQHLFTYHIFFHMFISIYLNKMRKLSLAIVVITGRAHSFHS